MNDKTKSKQFKINLYVTTMKFNVFHYTYCTVCHTQYTMNILPYMNWMKISNLNFSIQHHSWMHVCVDETITMKKFSLLCNSVSR